MPDFKFRFRAYPFVSTFQEREEGLQQLVRPRLLAPLRRLRSARPLVPAAGRGQGHDDQEPLRPQRRRRQMRGQTEDECRQIAVAANGPQFNDLGVGLAWGADCDSNFLRLRISFGFLTFVGWVVGLREGWKKVQR